MQRISPPKFCHPVGVIRCRRILHHGFMLHKDQGIHLPRPVPEELSATSTACILATGYLRLLTALAIAKARGAPSGSQNALDSLPPPREPVAAKSPGK